MLSKILGRFTVSHITIVLTFCLDVVLTLPAILAVLQYLQRPRSKPIIYQDQDGVSTAACTERYDIRPQTTLLLVSSSFGLLAAIAFAGLRALEWPGQLFWTDWLTATAWVSTKSQLPP